MSAPDTSPNLEPELPEMATLREWSRHERPPGIARASVKTRVWQTLNLRPGQHSRQRRGASWTRTLLATAVVAAVPGAFAATETGRHWAQQGLSMLPWIDDPTPAKVAAPAATSPLPSATATSPPLAAPSATVATVNLVTASPEVTAAASREFTARELAAQKLAAAGATASGAGVVASPTTNESTQPATLEPVRVGDRAARSEPVIARQIQAERQMLESARLALSRRDYSSARFWCTQHRAHFDHPILVQEREALEALVAASEKPTAGPKKY